MTKREKWRSFLEGKDVSTMVSPLCDKWCTDVPYKWTLDFEEPFKIGENNHMLSEQIMMAELFDWDPLFLASIDFKPKDSSLIPQIERELRDSGVTRITTTLKTPNGDLTMVEDECYGTRGLIKDFLDTEKDYENMIWYSKQIMDFDEEDAISQGKYIMDVVGDKGMVGPWFGLGVLFADIQNLFFHAIDYPELFSQLYEVKKAYIRKQLSVYQKIGFDYLFYVIPGTEWASPDFFEKWMYDEIKENIKTWRSSGGFTVWHTCGQEKAFMEHNYYNELEPDIFETLSEPPVGNLPSLKWGREQIDPKIVTKGNISLDIMLNGTQEEVKQQVNRVKESTKGYRHIIGLSDNVLDNTPYDNLKVYVEESRKES